ncbi:MAG: hypothetical protein MUO58_03115, partial [Anaerolineales bacterium]|nr:hypothetical protein [Anaerolineales bacterium]
QRSSAKPLRDGFWARTFQRLHQNLHQPPDGIRISQPIICINKRSMTLVLGYLFPFLDYSSEYCALQAR